MKAPNKKANKKKRVIEDEDQEMEEPEEEEEADADNDDEEDEEASEAKGGRSRNAKNKKKGNSSNLTSGNHVPMKSQSAKNGFKAGQKKGSDLKVSN